MDRPQHVRGGLEHLLALDVRAVRLDNGTVRVCGGASRVRVGRAAMDAPAAVAASDRRAAPSWRRTEQVEKLVRKARVLEVAPVENSLGDPGEDPARHSGMEAPALNGVERFARERVSHDAHRGIHLFSMSARVKARPARRGVTLRDHVLGG